MSEPVAGWTPATTPAEFQVIEWDLGSAVRSSGRIDVLFQYRQGAHRLEIEWAELVVDGESVSRDAHLGLTGARDVDNVYRLELPVLAGDARLALRARVRGGGGTDSHGELFVMPR